MFDKILRKIMFFHYGHCKQEIQELKDKLAKEIKIQQEFMDRINVSDSMVHYIALEKEQLEKKITDLEAIIVRQTKEIASLNKITGKKKQHEETTSQKNEQNEVEGEIVMQDPKTFHVNKKGHRTKTGVKMIMPSRNNNHKIKA